MQKNIHPTYYPTAKIVCSCGNIITVGATIKEAHVEICSACHPFYTGEKSKVIDIAGKVERFKARQEKTKKLLERKRKSKI